MVVTNAGGQLLVDRRRQGIGAFGFARHEEVIAVAALLMEIKLDVGLPAVEQGQSALALGVLVGQPVAVEVKPVVIGAAVGHVFPVLAIVGVGAGHQPPMTVGPVGKAVQAIGIEHGVENDHHVLELGLQGRVLHCIQIVGHQRSGVAAAGLVTVDAVHHVQHSGLVLEIWTGVRINDVTPGRLDGIQPGQVCLGRDGVADQGPAAVTGGMVPQGHHALRGVGESVQIGHDLVVIPVPLTHLDSHDLLGTRQAAVHSRAATQQVLQGQARGLGCAGAGHQE